MAHDFGFEPAIRDYYFVSYCGRYPDSLKRTEEICMDLNKIGVPLWYDRAIPLGEKYSSVIAKSIEASKAVIIFISNDLLNNPEGESGSYVLIEWKTARRRRKKIIPVFMDRIDETSIHPDFDEFYTLIEQVQGIDISDASSADAARRIQKLLIGATEKAVPATSKNSRIPLIEQAQRIDISDASSAEAARRIQKLPVGATEKLLSVNSNKESYIHKKDGEIDIYQNDDYSFTLYSAPRTTDGRGLSVRVCRTKHSSKNSDVLYEYNWSESLCIDLSISPVIYNGGILSFCLLYDSEPEHGVISGWFYQKDEFQILCPFDSNVKCVIASSKRSKDRKTPLEKWLKEIE